MPITMPKEIRVHDSGNCPNCHSTDVTIAATADNFFRLALVGIAAFTIIVPPCRVMFVCRKCHELFFRRI